MKKTPKKKRAAIASSDLLAALDFWGGIAHDDKGGFMERFCPKAWILTQVSWDSENMRFVYILECGQHVADSVKITEWLEFLSANSVIHRNSVSQTGDQVNHTGPKTEE